MLNGHLLRGFELHLATLLAVFALAECCHGAEPNANERRITIWSGRSLEYPYAEGSDRKGGLSFKARLAEVVKEDGQLVARGAIVSPDPLVSLENAKNGLAQYPELRKGDLVPIFSYIYRVTDLETSGGEAFKYGHMVHLEWVPNDKLPKGLGLGDHPNAAPLMGKIGINEHAIMPLKIYPPDEKKEGPGSKASAVLQVEPPTPGKPPYLPALPTARVRAGDILLLSELGYKVRNVVPKDGKTKAIGWVEFTLEPIKKADLERDKVPFVVPKPVPASTSKDK